MTHHVPSSLLFDYATGALAEGPALAVSTHLSYCGECLAALERLEEVGAAVLQSLEPATVESELLSRTLARLDEQGTDERRAEPEDAGEGTLPPVLRPHLGTTLARASWRFAAPHVREARLTLADTSHRASLLRVPAGRPVPHHTHRGVEYTVVLSGGFTDQGEAYRRGDFCATDPSVEHRPVAMDDAECLCLIVLDAPVMPTGRIGRLIAPFLR
ncbi:MAG: ChrR family anti-sigma-E factor [Alphaproteobacteria bacterium]